MSLPPEKNPAQHENPQTVGKVTLDDVARLAGVSAITVSRVLNTPEKVAQKTRDKVQQAVERLGYVPNMLAGALARRSSKLVAAIVPTIMNPVHAETVSYFSDAMRQKGYEVLLGQSGYDENHEEELITAILGRRPDGLLITGVKHTAKCQQQLLSSAIPVVEVWEVSPNPLDVMVGFSHEQIGVAIADFFSEKQLGDFAIVSAGDRRAVIREQAFCARIKATTGKTAFTVRTSAPSTYHEGRDALSSLIAQGFRRGGIFCSSDALAHGILTESRERGIKIPQEIAVMGFADLEFSSCTSPQLSTVYIDRQKMGQKAAEVLLQRIAGQPVAQPVQDIGFSIITRGST